MSNLVIPPPLTPPRKGEGKFELTHEFEIDALRDLRAVRVPTVGAQPRYAGRRDAVPPRGNGMTYLSR